MRMVVTSGLHRVMFGGSIPFQFGKTVECRMNPNLLYPIQAAYHKIGKQREEEERERESKREREQERKW